MLDFIRRNSFIVIVAIVAVAAGLIVSDYAGKSDRFGGNYVVKVGDKGYDRIDVDSIGSNAMHFIQRLSQLTLQKYQAPFDADGDGTLSESERATFTTVSGANPEVAANLGYFENVLWSWSLGSSRDAETNITAMRALIREEGKALGIIPGKEEVDAFIQSMPAFVKTDGSFDNEAYKTMCNYRKGQANREAERAFREVVEDLMIWQGLQAFFTSDMASYAPMENKLINMEAQEMMLRTAWLPKEKFVPAGDPGEEEIKAFWEQQKSNYKSTEKRIVTLYTFKALPNADGSQPTEEELMAAADNYMQKISVTNARGMDAMLEPASKDEEFAHFTYTKETFPLADEDKLAAPLQGKVDTGSNYVTLGTIAFEVSKAPTVEAYEKALADGSLDATVTLEQLRGFYPLEGGALALIRVEAIQSPVVLPYEEARAAALVDLREKMTTDALQKAAEELRERMEKEAVEGDLDKAFASAESAGAEVATYGPVALMSEDTLPEGLQVGMLATVKTGGISPLMPTEKGIRLAAVVSRTVVDSPEIAAYKTMRVLPVRNYRLQRKMMIDWLENAYRRYGVQFGPDARLNESN